MDLLYFFSWLNNEILAIPSTIIFLAVGIYLTIKTGFLQIRGLSKFIRLIKNGIPRRTGVKAEDIINPFHALFTAMATTIGVGNVVGPSVAIMVGGPGALFWLLLYIIIGSATKFAEVVFAINTRETTKDGYVVGGPVNYLQAVHPYLGYWYGFIMVFLFMGWSGVQANTLAQIYAQEHVPAWITGICLAIVTYLVLKGGAQRVGNVASKLVPLMFIGYVSFSIFILLKDIPALIAALKLVWHSIFSTSAPLGAFAGASVLQAMRYGVYRGIFITEAGTGTSSIPHAIADVQYSTDQGLLAMFSGAADAFLSLLSGLMVLVTGLWAQGALRGTLIYEVFKLNAPATGQLVLLASVTLFVLTTVIGNSFNGIQSFSALSNHRWVNFYILITLLNVVLGSLMRAALVWEIMDTLLAFVVIPNLIGIVILSIKKSQWLKVH